MSTLHVFSIVLLLAAVARCARGLYRTRDWRLAFPLLFLALLASHLVFMHDGRLGPIVLPPDGRPEEIAGLALAVLAFLSVGSLRRMFEDEAALRESASGLNEIIEKTPDFVGIASPSGAIEYVNPTGRYIVGLPEHGDLSDRTVAEFHPEWANDLLAREAFPTARRLGVWRGESALLHRSGKEIPGLQVVMAHFAESGELARYSTVVRTTEAYAASGDAIRERETRLRLLEEQLPAVVWSCDPQMVVKSAFGAGFARVGVEPEQLIGGHVGELIDDPVERYRILAAHQRALGRHVRRSGERDERGTNRDWESGLRPFDSLWHGRWFRGYVRPLRGESGEVIGAIGIGLDIHDQRLAEEEARERGMRVRMIAEHVPAILWSTDRHLKITSRFGAGLARYMAPEEAVVRGRWIGEVTPAGPGREKSLAASRTALEGESSAFESEFDGRTLQVAIRGLQDSDGRITGTVGVALDVTELRRTQKDLRATRAGLQALTARLERVREQERRALARDVHDELGQLLTSLRMEILGWIDELETDEPAELERATAQVRLVDAALTQVRSIAQRLRPPELDDMGLLDAVRSEVDDFSRRARITCELHTELPDLPPNFDRDTAIYRILRESLTNVARHAGASRVDVRLRRRNGALRLEVVDDGRGIDPEVDAGETLGVVGMRERARALGGTLTIESVPGGGTALSVELPIETHEPLGAPA